MKLLASVGLVALVAGCGSGTSAGDEPRSGSTTTYSLDSEISCGAVVLAQGEQLAVAGLEELACLEGALREGRSAALTVTAPTIEGDPIVTSWALSAEGTLSQGIDSSKDRYAGSPTTHYSCGRISELPDPLTCEPRG